MKKKKKKKKNLQEENTSKSLIIKLLVENLSEITKSNGLKIICQIESQINLVQMQNKYYFISPKKLTKIHNANSNSSTHFMEGNIAHIS